MKKYVVDFSVDMLPGKETKLPVHDVWKQVVRAGKSEEEVIKNIIVEFDRRGIPVNYVLSATLYDDYMEFIRKSK